MVNKCAAFGCKSGYKGYVHPDANIKITFHSFPLDNKELCDRWIRAISRENFTPSKYSRLCSLHFRATDFVEERADSNAARYRQKTISGGEKLSLRYLKEDAVPRIFPNAPKYISSVGSGPRETVSATASSRQLLEAGRLKKLEDSFNAADDISVIPLVEVCEQLKAETALPRGYTFSIVTEGLLIYWIQLHASVPSIKACITLQDDRKMVVSFDGKIVPPSQFADMVNGPVQRLSQLVNVMARIKAWIEDVQSISLKTNISMAISSLKNGLENLEDSQSDEHRKISFIIEQLKLLHKHKQGRHYSPELTVMAYRINAISPAAYNLLLDENILCLPSKSTLSRITKRLNSTTGLDNSAYLKLRVSKLNEYDRNCILMIDEIYIAKRVEYSGGELQGLTPDGSVASTVLCFMVKSLTSKYRDIVAMYPVCTLTAAKQYDCYQEVAALIHSVNLKLVAISVDNATANRKFYVDHLCGGTLRTSFTDPVTNKPIFLIFDPVHNLKNVYNNFQGENACFSLTVPCGNEKSRSCVEFVHN